MFAAEYSSNYPHNTRTCVIEKIKKEMAKKTKKE